jgi:hypothetical protein
MLPILAQSERFRTRYDDAKQEIPLVELIPTVSSDKQLWIHSSPHRKVETLVAVRVQFTVSRGVTPKIGCQPRHLGSVTSPSEPVLPFMRRNSMLIS